MTPDTPNSNVPDPKPQALPAEPAPAGAQIAPLLTDLLYPSESDEPIEVVQTNVPGSEPLTTDRVRQWLKLDASTPIEERPESDFWEPVTTIEDWFGEEEKANAQRFQALKEQIDRLLTDCRVYRVGETEIDTYLLGKPAEGPYCGLKTKVVET